MPEWKHLGNPGAHYEDFECSNCGRRRTISNRRADEPDPCPCWDDAGEKDAAV